MFDITLITMGKLKEKFYTAAAEEYTKRLGAYCTLSWWSFRNSVCPTIPLLLKYRWDWKKRRS